MKTIPASIIAVLGLAAVAAVSAQNLPRSGAVTSDPGARAPHPANPQRTVIAGRQKILHADLHLSGAPHMTAPGGASGDGAGQVGAQVLRPGESRAVGSEKFQVLANGSGRYGNKTAGNSISVDNFKASRISGTDNWRIDAVPGSDGSEFVDIQYDQGEGIGAYNGGDGLFYRVNWTDARLSTRFAPKASEADDREVRIDRIWLSPYYHNQFLDSQLPPTAPRDLTVYIYSDQGGVPGDVLFSKVVEDPRAFFRVTNYSFSHFAVDLSNEGIGALPDVVHIAYGNAGSDDNLLIMGLAPYTVENVSHLYPFNGIWVQLWKTTFNEDSFNEMVVPIRARFSLGSTTGPLSFDKGVADQSFPQGRSIAPVVLPEAAGGVPPINYSLTPALPAGLSFDSPTRTVSGTPMAATAAPLRVTYTATDASGDAASLQFNVVVHGRVHFAQAVADQSFPRAQPIVPLVLPEASGGQSPISYTLEPALPAGLGYVSLTRTISGTPTRVTAAPVRVTYLATDASGDAASLQFNIEVFSPVRSKHATLPEVFVVHGHYPNPFRQLTRLVFDLPAPARVAVEVMDMLGRRVLAPPPADVAAGWGNHLTLDGRSLPPGHYLYRMVLSSAEGTSTRTGHLVRVR